MDEEQLQLVLADHDGQSSFCTPVKPSKRARMCASPAHRVFRSPFDLGDSRWPIREELWAEQRSNEVPQDSVVRALENQDVGFSTSSLVAAANLAAMDKKTYRSVKGREACQKAYLAAEVGPNDDVPSFTMAESLVKGHIAQHSC